MEGQSSQFGPLMTYASHCLGREREREREWPACPYNLQVENMFKECVNLS